MTNVKFVKRFIQTDHIGLSNSAEWTKRQPESVKTFSLLIILYAWKLSSLQPFKKNSGEICVEFTEIDVRLPSLLYKKPLYKLSIQQVSQQTSGTAYIYTLVVDSNPRQPNAAHNNEQHMSFFFLSFLQMQSCAWVTKSPIRLSVNVLAKHFVTMQYFNINTWVHVQEGCNDSLDSRVELRQIRSALLLFHKCCTFLYKIKKCVSVK